MSDVCSQEIARRGVAILLVEQKLTIALKISHRLYVMGHGKIVFEGTPGGSDGRRGRPQGMARGVTTGASPRTSSGVCRRFWPPLRPALLKIGSDAEIGVEPAQAPCAHSFTIHIPSRWMARRHAMTGEIHRLRERQGDSEKITINLGFVDLGHIDLLVREGFYSNRTDFIRTAIRNQLASHTDAVKQSIVRHTLELGLRRFGRAGAGGGEGRRAAGSRSRFSGLRPSTTTSRRSSRARRSNPSPSSAPCTPAKPSRRRSPIASSDRRRGFSSTRIQP